MIKYQCQYFTNTINLAFSLYETATNYIKRLKIYIQNSVQKLHHDLELSVALSVFFILQISKLHFQSFLTQIKQTLFLSFSFFQA